MKCYRLNRFLHKLIEPEHRRRFLEEPEALFEELGPTSEERDLVRRRDWRGMIQHGVIFSMLEKLGAVVGVSNLHAYAAMRGEPLEEFLKTRNQPGALYSVAGKDATKLEWEKSAAHKQAWPPRGPDPRGFDSEGLLFRRRALVFNDFGPAP